MKTVLEPDEEYFQKIRKPKQGDWLWIHKEKPETFNVFRRNCGDLRKRSRRNKILVLPIGSFDESRAPSLVTLVNFASIYFQMPVDVLPGLEVVEQSTSSTIFSQNIKSKRKNTETKNNKTFNVRSRINETNELQLLTRDIEQVLVGLMPDNYCFCMIGVTMVDLYPKEDWNFVFGEADPSRFVGVFSFARYSPDFYLNAKQPKLSPEDAKKLLWRSCSVMVHEIGHMFGLPHCVYFQCNMNGSNHLDESDKQPLELCPVCLHKLEYTVGFSPITRYAELLEFCKIHSFGKEKRWLEGRIKLLQDKLKQVKQS